MSDLTVAEWRVDDVDAILTWCMPGSAPVGRRSGAPATSDVVDHPSHYTSHPARVECITIVEHLRFLRGNAIKYIWRAGAKGNEIEDLKKARWYVDREILRLERGHE